jgi:uncharacterized protein (TIGR03437 family)
MNERNKTEVIQCILFVVIVFLTVLACALATQAQTPPPIQAGLPVRIEVTPASVELQVGQTVQATVTAYDSTGAVVPMPPHSWTPNDLQRVVFLIEDGGGGPALAVSPNPVAVTVTRAPLRPRIFTDSSGRAIALHAVLMTREPFSIISPFNFGEDKRTRVSVFVTNIESGSPTTVTAMLNGTAAHVDYVGALPGIESVWQIIIRLPQTAQPGDANLILTINGMDSNAAPFAIQ